jgi:hypothetical protein
MFHVGGEPFPEQEGASVEGRSQDVRNEARKNAGSNPEDVSTWEGRAATLSRTGNTKPLVGYGTQSPESVRDFWSPEGSLTPYLPHRDYPAVPSLFNLSTSSPSTDPLRPCILAIRDGLRLRGRSQDLCNRG